MTERVSMKEWRPENLFDKKERLESQQKDIEAEKIMPSMRKKEIEGILAEYNVQLKQVPFSDPQYNIINSKRGVLVKEKTLIEMQLQEINARLQKIRRSADEVHNEIRRKPNDMIKQQLIELRDKYLSFSADTTRVSSMRSMSSKFVEEIQALLKYIV